MTFELAPAASPASDFVIAPAPAPAPRQPFDGFIQWRLNGVDLGDKRVDIVDFVTAPVIEG